MSGPRHAVMTQPDSPSKQPPRCGPYELLVRIGKGGMASVYLARRADDDSPEPRLFALKLLHPHLGREREFVDMLMDEAKLASQLDHALVVGTVDLGRDEDRYYTVMEYVEGVALDRLLRRSPEERRPELIVPLAIDALTGLQAAHDLSDPLGRPLELVHRDVTPGNLMVGVDGRGRIADFGVAKARARITKTNPGVIKGKAGYIAPEVILGRDIDGRADVFSMGVLLWNALTGETLFDTEDLASSLTALLEGDVPPPSTVGLMPPPIFDAPILGALHREAAHRHESAREMAEALEDALTIHAREVDRAAIGGWVREVFGEQLDKRREYAGRSHEPSGWEPDQAEQLSTSALVRKDPTGQIVAIPAMRDGPGLDESAHDLSARSSRSEAPTEPPAAPPSRALRVVAAAALAVAALVGAGLVGAWVATGGRAFETPSDPPAPPVADAPREPSPAEEPREVEITPELFGGRPREAPEPEDAEERAGGEARRARRRRAPSPAPTGDDATGGNAAGDDATGDDAAGGDSAGGDSAGGDAAGGDAAGGDAAGDDAAGDDAAGAGRGAATAGDEPRAPSAAPGAAGPESPAAPSAASETAAPEAAAPAGAAPARGRGGPAEPGASASASGAMDPSAPTTPEARARRGASDESSPTAPAQTAPAQTAPAD